MTAMMQKLQLVHPCAHKTEKQQNMQNNESDGNPMDIRWKSDGNPMDFRWFRVSANRAKVAHKNKTRAKVAHTNINKRTCVSAESQIKRSTHRRRNVVHGSEPTGMLL